MKSMAKYCKNTRVCTKIFSTGALNVRLYENHITDRDQRFTIVEKFTSRDSGTNLKSSSSAILGYTGLVLQNTFSRTKSVVLSR